MYCLESNDSSGWDFCQSVETFESEFGIDLFHLGRAAPVSFSAATEIDLIPFTPMTFSAACPKRTLQPTAFSASAKCSAIHAAGFSLLIDPARRCLMKSPVLMPTGQAVAHSPSAAQV